VQLGQKKLLPIDVDPVIADYHRQRAEIALATLDLHLAQNNYLCAAEPTIADLFCYGDIAFAELCAFDLASWTNIDNWAKNVKSLPGLKAPLELLSMQDPELSQVS
jgi:glutathione S-transferase